MKNDDNRMIESSGNVFADLGFDPVEAEIMKLRTEFMIRTAQRIKEQGLTQVEAAKQLKITQPRVSRLLKGNAEDFSLDMLYTLATRAGLHPQVKF